MKKQILTTLAVVCTAFLFLSVVRSQIRKSPVPQTPYQEAADYSKRMRGLSVLVIVDGKTVFEEYQNGHSSDKPHMLASGTKSFTGVLLAAAIEDGLATGFDEKVSDTITEWKSDKDKAAITLRQLLSLTSGIDAGRSGRPQPYSAAFKNSVRYKAGTRFQYGPAPFQIFGEVMRRKLLPKKETVEGYLKRRILDPIGLTVAEWNKQEGQIDLPSGAYLTAREWAKFGEFLLDEGKWNGRQIVKAKLLRELAEGSEANPNYGISFWLNNDHSGKASLAEPANRRGSRLLDLLNITSATDKVSKNGLGSKLPKDIFTAAGAANQRLYLIPSKKMIVVRQGKMARYEDETFLSILLDVK